jgi:hypothetical protein
VFNARSHKQQQREEQLLHYNNSILNGEKVRSNLGGEEDDRLAGDILSPRPVP